MPKRELPLSIDWSQYAQTQPVYDQAHVGCCCACTLATSLSFLYRTQHHQVYEFSPLFLYYVTRRMFGKSGFTLQESLDALSRYGICEERHWPLEPARAKERPSFRAYKNAARFKSFQYETVPQDLHAILSRLAKGYLITVGIHVYASFYSKSVLRSGKVYLPRAERDSNDEDRGGHAILLVGYNHPKRRFLFQNSWSDTVGYAGIFSIPYEYILSSRLCSELFMITSVRASF